ncbi:MAG TPA: DpnII family type II restriction endonuclease, partial [Candidatus Acidoferrales bacterium]|nr:DpnII family type II restriction endonuclease [Candidatus Acidoferrales bacterium]
ARGRFLEDFTEKIVRAVFGDAYDTRCRFVGASGTSTEKTDFAIPSKRDACILIEVKAYGATGSKQTDILGDIRRIVEEKRHDTHLLLVTDGTTWKARVNDLRKLVEMQNKGLIARIYTHSMEEALQHDLRQLRRDHGL